MPQQPYPPHGQNSPYGGQQGPHQPQPQPQQYGQQWAPQQQPDQFGFAQQRPQHPTNVPVQLPASKKRKKWPWILLVVLAVMILAFAGCMSALSSAVDSMPGGKAATVTYSLEGSGSATAVSYNVSGTGGIAQESKASLPWTKEVPFPEGSFRVATLTAQNAGGGDITCKIAVDGKVVREVTSSGQYAVVSCTTDAF